MSLRLRRASTPLMDDSRSIFEDLKPYIEKLLLTPQGVGMVALLVGVLLRMSHTPAVYLTGPLQGPDQSKEAHMMHPAKLGLDVELFAFDTTWFTTISTNTNDDPFWNWLKGAFHVPDATLGSTSSVHLLLSDALIIAGIAGLGGSAISGLLGKLKA